MNLRMILSAGLIAASAGAMSIGHAGDNGNRGDGFWKAFEPSVDGEENVVISLSADPTQNPEPACVAVQIGINLLLDDLNGDMDGGNVTPVDSVTLFATLDGVQLLNPVNVGDIELAECTTPGVKESLHNLVNRFVAEGGEIVICPLCWKDRKLLGEVEEPPTYDAVKATPFDIHDLFRYADKIISF
jgi:hypothetical protein